MTNIDPNQNKLIAISRFMSRFVPSALGPLVRLVRFERMTYRVGVCYSIQLSYRRIFLLPKIRQLYFYNYLAFEPHGKSMSGKITLHEPSGISAAQIIPLDSTPHNLTGFKLATTKTFLPTRSSGAYH